MGLGADSGVGTWAVGAATVVAAIIAAVYANEYCLQYESNSNSPNQNVVYYNSQYVRILGALTAGVAVIYVAWTFVDSRHPAKQSLWTVNAKRLQASRVQAKRNHIQKLAAVEGVLAVMWIPPVFIFAFKGYLYRGKTTNGANASSVCEGDNVANCEALKRAGITTLVVAVLIVLALILTLIPFSVKPKGAKPKTDEEKKKEADEKKKKEEEELRKAGNRIRRSLGLPEILENGFDPMNPHGVDWPAGAGGPLGGALGYPPLWGPGGGGYFGSRRHGYRSIPRGRTSYGHGSGSGAGAGGGGGGGGGGGAGAGATNIVGFGFPMGMGGMGMANTNTGHKSRNARHRHRHHRPPAPPPSSNSSGRGIYSLPSSSSDSSSSTGSDRFAYPSPLARALRRTIKHGGRR